MNIQENTDQHKQPPYEQLEILVGVLHELQRDRVNCTNEFIILKKVSLQTPHN